MGGCEDGSWRGFRNLDDHSELTENKGYFHASRARFVRAHTAIKDEFELNQLHVDYIRNNGFMGEAHAKMFDLN